MVTEAPSILPQAVACPYAPAMDLGTRSTPFTPYGPWSTIALTGVVLIGSSILAWALMMAVNAAPAGIKADSATFAYSVIANLIGIVAIAKLADMRAPGRTASYLALRPFDTNAAWRWLAVAAAFYAADWIIEVALRQAIDMPAPPNWLDEAVLGPMMVLSIVIVGPIFEELMFRGFMMEGLIPTRLGQSGALALSTLAWTLLHGDYDALSMMLVFGTGIIFGLARLTTGSLLLSILLHMAWNAVWVLQAYA